MLFNRPYIRGGYRRETTSVVTWLVCAIAGAFVIQFAADSLWLASPARLARQFAFSIDGLVAGRIWTPLTHWLLHSTSNLFHVGFVVTALWLLGRELVGDLGARRFVGVFGSCILAGAILWGAMSGSTGGELIGSAAGIYGLIAIHALLHPNREIRFLFFFFFPVTFRPRHVAAALFLADLLALVLVDILGRTLPFTYAPAAHLGGMLAGGAYGLFFHRSGWRFGQPARTGPHERSSSHMTVSPPIATDDSSVAPSPSRADLRLQVDRILDKINSKGFGALTPAERRILDDARDLLSRR
jgi:membrane associated rhomboid family serine protease